MHSTKLIYFLSFQDDAEVLKLAERNGSTVYFCLARVTEILSAPLPPAKFLISDQTTVRRSTKMDAEFELTPDFVTPSGSPFV